MNRRQWLTLALGVSAGVSGCKNGEWCILGYTTEPPFDPNIRSVYIPTFKLNAFVAGPYRSIDVELTEAVVRELNARRSPIRVISDPLKADTELVGTIVQVQKNVWNRNPQNLTREAEIVIVADIVWRDLRTGEILTNPQPPQPPPSTTGVFDNSVPAPPPPPPNDQPKPARISAMGRALPEVGESNATAVKTATERMARNIVNMMERNWNTK